MCWIPLENIFLPRVAHSMMRKGCWIVSFHGHLLLVYDRYMASTTLFLFLFFLYTVWLLVSLFAPRLLPT